MVASVWDELLPDQMIYGGSASAFRSRWDAILRKLNGMEYQFFPSSDTGVTTWWRGHRCLETRRSYRTAEVDDASVAPANAGFLSSRDGCSKCAAFAPWKCSGPHTAVTLPPAIPYWK